MTFPLTEWYQALCWWSQSCTIPPTTSTFRNDGILLHSPSGQITLVKCLCDPTFCKRTLTLLHLATFYYCRRVIENCKLHSPLFATYIHRALLKGFQCLLSTLFGILYYSVVALFVFWSKECPETLHQHRIIFYKHYHSPVQPNYTTRLKISNLEALEISQI